MKAAAKKIRQRSTPSDDSEMAEKPSILGGVPDVLFQIINMGDVSTIPVLCRLNKATRNTIKAHELLICTSYLRHHNIPPLDPILMLDRTTGRAQKLTIKNLQTFTKRQETARQLASRVARSGWGAWWAIPDPGMDADAELFRQRVERGLYIMFHMADIVRDVERVKPDRYPFALGFHRNLMSNRLPRASVPRKKLMWWLPRHIAHIYTVLLRKSQQREIGGRRRLFRLHLDEEREIDFHIALQMLRLFLETIIFAHSPDDENSMIEDGGIMCWFLLRQRAPSLARIFLELPDTKCCSIEDRASKDNFVCNYADALKEYWAARNGDPSLDCKHCESWLRSLSDDVVLSDPSGLTYTRQAREWVKEMRGEGHSLSRG